MQPSAASNAPETRRSLVLGCIMLAMFMVAIEVTIVATAMPQIVGRLGGFSLYSWVFAGFLLTQTATTVMFGKLSDLYGRRPVLIGGIALFLVGSVLCGFAWSMPSLIAFRLMQGFGAGSIMPVAMTLVGDLYTPEERGSVQGYLSSVWGISAVVGPLVGGIIVERFSWPWVFWINIPIGVATMVGLATFLHEGVERKRHQIDFPGATLFTVAISSLLIVLSQLGQGSAVSSTIPIFLVLLAASVPLFLWQERRATDPMLALDLWTDRLIASSNGAALAGGMTMMGITAFLGIYVQGVMGWSAEVAGLTLTMMAVGWPVASVLSRRFYGWIGMRGTLRLGTVLIVIGSVCFLFLNPESSPALAGVGSGVMGFGMGLLTVTSVILIQGSVPWSRRGSATASNVFARNLGSTLGAAILGSVLNYGLRNAGGAGNAGVSPEGIRQLLEKPVSGPERQVLQAALDHSLHLTFWCVVAMAVLTAALALFIPSRNLEDLSGGAKG